MTIEHNAGNIPPMDTPDLLARIDRCLAIRGVSENAACEKAKIDRGTIRDLRRGKRISLTLATLQKLAQALDVPIGWLTGDTAVGDGAPSLRVVERGSQPTDSVPEVSTRGGLGAGGIQAFDPVTTTNGVTIAEDLIADEWGIPEAFVRVLRTSRRALRIMEVDGDSGYDPSRPDLPGSLLPGDKVFIDIADRRPSPPGPFALWDGVGVVVKWVEVDDTADAPMVILRSRNPAYSERRRHIDEVRILGRVRGRITLF